jgi:NADH-quinone oxidoreductase subunit F
VFEVPFGATLRELLVLAGGIAGSGKLQAALIGGAAGAFLAQKISTQR